jgi:hypothetical protein
MATNLATTTLASGAKTQNKFLARILEHFSLSCKSTCKWARNPVATTLAIGAKSEKGFSMDSGAFLSQLQVHL